MSPVSKGLKYEPHTHFSRELGSHVKKLDIIVIM